MNERHDWSLMNDFLGGYFHQDWDLDAKTWHDVVDHYLKDAHAEAAQALANEIRSYLGWRPVETKSEPFLAQFSCDYLPSAGGLSDHDWLEQVAAQLARGATP
ncbi:MAG TPA: contact-dependent growth inhibition system immunity protein [Kofleriaceae bacterium]|jgi:hypothetical protein